MKRSSFLTGILLLAWAVLGIQGAPLPAPVPVPPVDDARLDGLLKDVPVVIMEYHILFATPFQGSPEHRFWAKWTEGATSEPDQAAGPAWRRRLASSAYPLIGPYSSEDPEVIRWQLRCLKAAGVDAAEVQMYPDPKAGLTYQRADLFAKMLDLAAEEGVHLFIHDEVMFVRGEALKEEIPGVPSYRDGTMLYRSSAAQQRENMTRRLADTLQRFGSHPGYYKWNGKPAFAFQYWGRFMPVDDLARTLHDVNAAVPSGVSFLLNAGAGNPELRNIPEIATLLGGTNSGCIRPASERSPLDWARIEGVAQRFAAQRAQTDGMPAKSLGVWLYPGFDDASAQASGPGRWLSRGDGLAPFKATVLRLAREKPDLFLFSAWNEWRENTAFEPSLDVDGRGGDPYEGIRLLARLKGKAFVPPPLPPFDHLDPWIGAFHGGPDKTPPYPANVWIAPNSQEVRAAFLDETSPVREARIARSATAVADWSGDGGPLATGWKEEAKSPVAEAGGRHGASLDHPVRLILPPGLGAGEAWAAVTFFDAVPGRIVIMPPGDRPALVEPTDKYAVSPVYPIACTGSGRWRTVVRTLGAVPAEGGAFEARFIKGGHPAAGQAAPPPVLGRIALVTPPDFSNEEVYEEGAGSDRSAVTFRFRHVPWDPQSLETVLLQGVDSHGNACLPVAVTPGLAGSPRFAPYPLE